MGQAKSNLELFNAGYSYAGITGVIKILKNYFAHFVSLRLNKVPKDLIRAEGLIPRRSASGLLIFFIFWSIMSIMIAEYYLGLKFNFSHFSFLCAGVVHKNVSLSLPPPPNFSIK